MDRNQRAGGDAMMKFSAVFAWLLLASPVVAQDSPAAPEPDAPQPGKPEAPVAPPKTPTAPKQAATGALVPPKLVQESPPVYPEAAKQARIGTVVKLLITIDEQGQVSEAVPVENPAEQFAEEFARAAIDAAKKLRFAPATRDGKALAVKVNYSYRFEAPPLPTPEPAPVETRAKPDSPKPPTKAPQVNVAGTIVERGSRNPVPGVVVTVFRGTGADAEGFESVSDAKGRFQFFDLAPGEWRVQAEGPGYYPYRTSESVVKNEALSLRYFIERGSYNPYDVTVEASRPKKEVTRRSLGAADIAKVAGTLGDPVLVVENLPGVARPTPGSGDLLIRGSGPQDTGVFIDGISIPLIYHFAGLRSVIPAEIVEGVDLYPGNYSEYYGRFTGGVFNARIKELKPKRLGGSVDISALDASLYLEAPLGDTAAIAIAGRRSYIDAVLNLAVPDDAPVDLVTAPRYYDYQLIFNWRPAKEHFFRVFGLGSDDKLALLFENPAEVNVQLQNGNAGLTTTFQRLATEYRYTPNARFRATTLLAAGVDDIRFNFGADQFRYFQNQFLLQARQNLSYKIHPTLELIAGFDGLYDLNDVEVLAPRPPREGDISNNNDFSEVVFTNVENYGRSRAGLYTEAVWRPTERLQAVPGVRLDYTQRVDNPWSVDPRLNVRYALDKQWSVKAGAAIVHQSPTLQELNPEFGNPDLELIRGFQYSAGVEWRPAEHLSFDVTGFYKDLDNLTSTSSATVMRDGETVPEVLNNDATGRVIGIEFFAEHKFHKNFRGWLAYTLSRARRTDSGAMSSRFFDFDQTHILNINASYQLPKNWEFGVRWRLVSGNPTTPVIGAGFGVDFDEYSPVLGGANTDRLPMFHQLDIRVDKKWIYDSWIFSAYLSLNNAYNRGNPEARSYNFNFTESDVTTGLPLFPILGVKGEF